VVAGGPVAGETRDSQGQPAGAAHVPTMRTVWVVERCSNPETVEDTALLTICSLQTTRTCDQMDCRDFLSIGALGLGGC